MKKKKKKNPSAQLTKTVTRSNTIIIIDTTTRLYVVCVSFQTIVVKVRTVSRLSSIDANKHSARWRFERPIASSRFRRYIVAVRKFCNFFSLSLSLFLSRIALLQGIIMRSTTYTIITATPYGVQSLYDSGENDNVSQC